MTAIPITGMYHSGIMDCGSVGGGGGSGSVGGYDGMGGSLAYTWLKPPDAPGKS